MEPLVVSLLTCGRVIFDRITGLASIIDIIGNINSPNFPFRQNLVVFCEMTNGHGSCEIETKIVKAEQVDKIIFAQKRAMDFKNIKQILSFALNIQGIVFDSPGEYILGVYADNKLLAERRLYCRKINLPNQQGNNS